MNYTELTGVGQGRYDGYMDPNTPEKSSSSDRGENQDTEQDPVKNLLQKGEAGEQETEAPKEASAERKRQEENKRLINSRRTTQEYLRNIAEDVRNPNQSGSTIRAYADQLIYSSRMLEAKLKGKELEEFQKSKILEETQLLASAMDKARQRVREEGGGQDAQKASQARLDQEMRGRANHVAELALAMRPYFEKDVIAQPEKDVYKPILSFEELMTKFVPVVEEKFRPGGEFSLIDIKKEVDAFGREIFHEEAHPENFMQYIREKAEFYHDFDPYKPINLFQNLYLSLGFRTATVYELLVDFPQYFYKRQDTFGDLEVNINDINKSEIFRKAELSSRPERGDIYGYYSYTDKDTGKTKQLTVRIDGFQEGIPVFFRVFDIITNSDGTVQEMPFQALVEDMDKRETKINPEYEEIKEALLYDVWLFNEWHNNDVNYRQNGMPTESELKKVMAEVCAFNILTHTRKRLLGDLRMPSVSNKEEMAAFKRGEYKKPGMQGSVGKAEQRAIALYYHLSEANAYLLKEGKPKYLIEGENPFEQLLRGTDVNASQYFYKGLIKETLLEDFPEKIPAVARELMEIVNGEKDAWQNLDLADLLFSGQNELLGELDRRGKRQSFDAGVKKLREKYSQGSDERKMLDLLVDGTAQNKKREFFTSIDRELGNTTYVQSSDREGLEDFALKFLVRTFDKEYTADANIYAHINYDQRAKERVKRAIRNAIQQTEKISGFEAKYAEERAFALSYFLGISARNDMNGIGHDAWSKVLNTEFYRLRQTSGGNYPGNLDNLYGIHRLGVDMLQGLKVQPEGTNKLDKTLYEEITGFNGENFTGINKPIETFDFQGNAMRQFHADHLGHAIDLFVDLTQKHEFNIDKLVKKDDRGDLKFNPEEMQKMIDSTWKHMRYGFDNRGFLYDKMLYGWWYDERINEDGAVSRTPHFGAKTIRNLMFGKEVQGLRMYERRDLSGWSGYDKKGEPTDVFHTKMGRNVFAYIIAAQLREHTRFDGGYRVYSADEVEMITRAFIKYAARVMKGENGEAIVLGGFFTPEEIMRMLSTGNSILWMLYLKELGVSTASGFFFGFFEALALIMKEAGAGIKL